jgi:hypothetical protein
VSLVVVILIASSSAPASRADLPALLTQQSASQPFAVRPAAVAFTGDNSGFLGGRDGSPRWDAAHGTYIDLGHFRWSLWTSKQATGAGIVWGRTCWKARCAHRFSPFAVTVYASAPTAGHFTRLTIRYKNGSAPDCRRLEHYASTGYIWSAAVRC